MSTDLMAVKTTEVAPTLSAIERRAMPFGTGAPRKSRNASRMSWRTDICLSFYRLFGPHQHFHVLVFLVEQAVVTLADEIIEPDVVGDEQIATEARVGHDSDGFVVEAVAAHAAGDGFFAENDIGEIDGSGFFEYAHDYQAAAGACQFGRHQYRSGLTGAFHDEIETFPVGNFESAFSGIFAGGIDDGIRAAEFRGFDASFGHLERDYAFCAANASSHQRHQADGSRADDCDIVRGPRLTLGNSPDGGRKRLDQRADFIRDRIGEVITLVGVEIEPLGQC